MPVYEFKCPEHGKFEKLKMIDSAYMEPCPKCGRLSKKLISLSHFNNYPIKGARASYNGKVLWEK